MSTEQFNDERLQNLARYHLHTSTNSEPQTQDRVRKLVNKDKLENAERNELVEFIDNSKVSRPKSMRAMKDEILTMVGATPTGSYSNVPTSAEIKAIYEFMCENFKKKGK
jgi:hypothetical protein